ncbi:MAG: SpoIIE family protein phosphatase [Microscillaceae bacterium]|nr:SpoIIE family protein phosphatase [Microscillaceae bacterium]
MLSLFRTIRSKLLFAFFSFLLITAGFIVLADFWFDAQEQTIQRTLDDLNNINVNLQRVEKLEYAFFKDDIINEGFHKTGNSKILQDRHKYFTNIKSNLKTLKKSGVIRSLDISKEIDQLIENFDLNDRNFQKLVELTRQRGFKSYGIEGNMRKYIHSIENADNNYDRATMLMIRRHEKDFIIRKQKSYIQSLKDEVAKLRRQVAGQPEMLKDLIEYEANFIKLAEIEERMGFTNQEGLKKELYVLGQRNNQKIEELNTAIDQAVRNLRTQNKAIQSLLILMGTGLVFILVFFVTRSLSKPISNLSNSIHQVIKHNFSNEIKFDLQIYSNDELGTLSQDVSYMVQTVQNNIAEIQDQKAKLEKKQSILMEGVSYAKRIQQAILPEYMISHHFKKFFVIYRPLFDVSGDFYWFTELNGKKYIAVVDCTGKGVSGAFMSMIGNTLLNQVINEKKLEDLTLILETLNTEFKSLFNQDQRMTDDRMDVCLCTVQPHPEKPDYWLVNFAGANRPLYYSQGWELVEVKGTERSIGGRNMNQEKSFATEVFELKKGNFLYLTSDGFINQHNKEQKKYGSTQLKEFLRRIVHLPVKQQEQRLNQELNHYMQGVSQRDDITLLVLKL